MDEMNKLLNKAEKHCTGEMVCCKYLYRNKEEGHFEDILDGDGILKMNLKEDAGDPRNPINDKIKGIFFTATVDKGSKTGEPIRTSPYGSSRLQISIDYLIHPSKSNLYFADFYCVSEASYHYVVLVASEPKSADNNFYVNHLPKLEWDKNKFLISSNENVFQVSSANNVIVEVLYTSEIDIKKALDAEKATLEEDIPVSKLNYGVPKNKECRTCNLWKSPLRPSKKKTFGPSDDDDGLLSQIDPIHS